MSANLLGTISWISFILAFIFAAIAVYIFIKFKIKDVINDLNGKTAQKEIELLKENSSKTKTTESFNFKDSKKTKKIKSQNLKETTFSTVQPNEKTFENTIDLDDDAMATTVLNDVDSKVSTKTVILNDMNMNRSIEFEVIETQMFIQTNEFI